MQNLKNEMTKLVRRIEAVFRVELHGDDLHHLVCSRIADEFELWDSRNRFPLWLSYVVQGIGRDLGMLD